MFAWKMLLVKQLKMSIFGLFMSWSVRWSQSGTVISSQLTPVSSNQASVCRLFILPMTDDDDHEPILSADQLARSCWLVGIVSLWLVH